MNSSDYQKIDLELTQALSTFDWEETEKICEQLIAKIYQDEDVFPESNSKNLLAKLRRKRRFQLMARVAEAIMRSGQVHSQIQRQYAQALIDQDILTAAEYVLKAITNDPSAPKTEEIEARGLTGRIYKQLYINADGCNKTKTQIFFERAINEYYYGYQLDRKNYWHGINVVALLKRGRRDDISIQGRPDADGIAQEILNTLKFNEENSSDPPQVWDLATKLEALIALNRYKEAIATAFEYSSSEMADAFEINSTFRQLTEVWQLNVEEYPGSEILPILRSALLSRECGQITMTHTEAALEVKKLHGDGLEQVFGDDRSVPLKWYRTGLERSDSVARIERLNGNGHGTGWLVKRGDFFPGSDGLMLVTNAHVISQNPADSGLPPDQVQANFQGIQKIYELGEIIWSSTQNKLDTTFVSFKGEEPPVEPLPVESNPIRVGNPPPPRFYIIGHPGGRDLEFSIHDNQFVAANETFLHYRTPTEGGSSGSPVFDQFGWRVVALHHRGLSQMPRIDGQPGTYEANEGIKILAIKNAIDNGNGN